MSDGKPALKLVPGEVGGSPADVDASGVVGSGESEQALLRAGKISVDEYIDMTVDRALAHLRDQVSSQRFEMMRQVLRSELEQDPHLGSLVQRVAEGD